MRRGLGVFLLLWLVGSSTPTWSQPSEFFPLEEVRPGLRGIGKTVFAGTQIEEFQVEILGVLENIGPRQNLVLARLSGEKVEQYGVCAGMSGSPVYIDGRLLGAVAYAFSFATEPIAGITPISEMVEVFRQSPLRTFRLSPSARPNLRGLRDFEQIGWVKRFAARHPFQAVQSAWGTLRPIRVPLQLSGAVGRIPDPFTGWLEAAGFLPVVGSAAAVNDEWRQAPLEPGSPVVVQLIRGDLEVSASGTVTYVSGQQIFAFGHPFLGVGNTDLPMAKAAVLGVIPNLMNSQKIAATLDPVGVIRQDRSTGILGVKGAQPRLTPLEVKLEASSGIEHSYRYELVTDTLLTPFLVAFAVNNSINAVERSLGDQTIDLTCRVRLKNYPEAVFETSISDPGGASALAALAASAPVDVLMTSGFEDLEIESISVELTAAEESREAVLEKVWQEKLEARPGEEVDISVFLRLPNGQTRQETYPIKIPEGVEPGALKIWIGDGLTLSRVEADEEDAEFIPQNLGQLVRAINNLKKNDRLYIRIFREQPGAVVGGEGLPGLPPSVLALYQSKKTTGDVQPIRRVVYVEHELPETDYVLSGQKTIEIQVKG